MKSTNTRFDEFWANYPKRVGRLEALAQWAKIDDEEIDQVLLGLKRWKCTEQWKNIQFVMEAARFLRRRRWEDEVPIAKRAEENMQVETQGGPRKDYLEFIDLRDAGKIPKDVNWEKWRKMTEDERQEVLKAA